MSQNSPPDFSPPPESSPNPAPGSPQSPGNRPTDPKVLIFQRPPRFIPLMGMLLVEPRQWAIAARYRVRVVFWPLMLMLVVSSLLTAYPMADGIFQLARQFVASYDKSFDPMLLSGGKLSVIPVPGKKPLKIVGAEGKLIVRSDVTGLYRDTSMPMVMVLTQNHLVYTGSWPMFSTPKKSVSLRKVQVLLALSNGLKVPRGASGLQNPPPMKVKSATLLALINTNRFAIMLFFTFMFGLVVFLSSGIWTLLMIVLVSPMIAMINRANGMPLGRAYRISMAIMVPLLAIRGLLVFFHIVPLESESAIVSLLLFISPLPLSVWAAVLATRMYAPPHKTV